MHTSTAVKLLALTLTLNLSGLVAPSFAANGALDAPPKQHRENKPDFATCHTLMTQQECDQFVATLAELNPGPDRDRYLAEHEIVRLEREAACSCNQKMITGTTHTQRRQAMLRL